MSDFFPSLLRKVNHQLLSKPQCSLFSEPHSTRGQRVQLSPDPHASPKLDKNIKFVQSVVEVELCVVRLIDDTILVATNDTGVQQTTSAQNTLSLCAWLLQPTWENISILL